MTADIEIIMKENGSTIGAFLDVASAYDNVRRDLLVQKLIKEKCPIKIVNYINQWMKDRKIKFIISQDKEEWRIINKDLPQGGVLSPMLYAIYTNEIHQEIRNNCQILQYADDIVIYTTRKEEEKDARIKEIETAVDIIDKNLEKIGLQI